MDELIIGDEDMKDDFGCFGTGLEGYVHYMEEFNRSSDNVTPGNIGCGDSWNEDLFDDDSDMDYDNEDDISEDSDLEDKDDA